MATTDDLGWFYQGGHTWSCLAAYMEWTDAPIWDHAHGRLMRRLLHTPCPEGGYALHAARLAEAVWMEYCWNFGQDPEYAIIMIHGDLSRTFTVGATRLDAFVGLGRSMMPRARWPAESGASRASRRISIKSVDAPGLRAQTPHRPRPFYDL